jgi:hypothetical protein
MPRPEKFTEAVRRRRQRERLQQDNPDWEAPRPAPLDWEAPRPMPPATKPIDGSLKEAEGDAADLIRDFLYVRASPALATELAGLLLNAEWEWHARRDIQPDPSLPVLGDIQPTPDEMRAMIDEGLKHALKLREWSRSLPAALLVNETVPLTTPPYRRGPPPPLQAVIESLAETLGRLSALYKPQRGRPPGRREAAQWAAGPLMLFAYRYAPEATDKQRRTFVRECLGRVGIECPDPNNHPNKFARWFQPVETAAKRGLSTIARPRGGAAPPCDRPSVTG